MPAEAQVPGNFHSPPDLEDFTRGTVDHCGITYELAYSPLVVPLELQDTEVGCSVPLTQDRDADGFWDQAEAELVWAFAPWIEFDEKEDYVSGMTMVYQAVPDRALWATRGMHQLRIRLIFLFADDRSHTGDSESVTVLLVSSDPEARRWRLHQVSNFNKGVIALRQNELQDLCIDHGASAPPQLGLQAFYCGSWFDKLYYDPLVGSLNSRTDSGMIHPRVWISDGKHGVYPTREVCEDWKTLHEFSGEDCGLDNDENQRGILLPGIPLAGGDDRLYMDNADDTLWTIPLLQFQSTGNPQGIRDLIYRGNLGELNALLLEDIPWFPGESARLRCFCGGHRPNCAGHLPLVDNSCSNCVSWEGDGDGYSCGAGILGKMVSPQLAYQTSSCTIVDSDQDGVNDDFDCEPYNPKLKGDWDKDGLCDAAPVDEAACVEHCHHYKITDPNLCEFRCRTPDPCVFDAPGLAMCRDLRARVLPYRRLHQLSEDEKTRFAQCQKMYGNTLFQHRRLNGAYEYVVADHLCGNLEWSWTDAGIVTREASATREVTGPSGQKITIPMICTGQYSEATVYWAGGRFQYGNDTVTAVNRDYPTSWMVCGIDPVIGRVEDCDVSVDGDEDEIPWTAMEPLTDPLGGWDLTDPARHGYTEVAWSGKWFRHKKLVFSPERPSLGGAGHKRFSSIWYTQTALSGQRTLFRFSHPELEKLRDEEFLLGSRERSASPWISSQATTIQPVQCRPYQPEDLLCSESTRSAPELIRDMPAFAVTPTGRPEMPGLLLRKAPTECAAGLYIQPLQGPSLSPGVLKPVELAPAFRSLVFDGSVPKVLGTVKTLQKSAIPDEIPVLWWFFPDREPVGFVETATRWQTVTWSQVMPAPWEPLGNVVSVIDDPAGFWVAVSSPEDPDHLLLYDPRWADPGERALRVPVPADLATMTPWLVPSPRRWVFLGGQRDRLPFTDLVTGRLQELTLSEPLALGDRPLVVAAEDAAVVWVVTADRKLAVINLLTGSVVVRGQFDANFDQDHAWLLPGGQDVSVVTVDEDGADADNTVVHTFDGAMGTITTSQLSPALPIDDPLNPGTWVVTPEEPPTRPSADSGCGCVSGRTTGNAGWWFPILLLALVLFRFRRHVPKGLLLFPLVFLLAACDDTPRPRPDADVDGDVEDLVDADVNDADVLEDVPEYPGCTPWFGQNPVPATAITRFQMPGVQKGEILLNFNGDYGEKVVFQFDINESYPWSVEYPNGAAWVWDLRTHDATIISEGTYIWEPSLFGDHVVSTGKVVADETTHVFTYQFSTNQWQVVADYSPQLYYWSPSAGPQFAWLSRHYEPDANTLECGLVQLDYSTGHLTPIFQEEFTRCSDAFEVSDRVQAFCGTTETGLGLHVLYDGEHRVYPPELFDGYSCRSPTIQGDHVLLKSRKWLQATVSGELVDYLHYQTYVLHVPSGEITAVDPDRFWDTSGHSIHWPLVVYRNYKVGCRGGTDAFDFHAYLMIKNMETGVSRPIPFPAPISSSDGLYELLAVEIMPNPWRLLVANEGNPREVPDIIGELILIDLEAAGYVEPDGTVIPDPTYPPNPGN